MKKQMKHGFKFDEKDELIDKGGTCADCGKPYASFEDCDCDISARDENRAVLVDATKICIAVVTTFEGNQEVVKTTSLAEVARLSYYLQSFLEKHPEARPVNGYQGPEPHFMYGRESGHGVAVNFFLVSKETDEVKEIA